MSSSEGENFDLDDVSGSESEEGYAPVKKVRAALSLAGQVFMFHADQSSGQETSGQGQACVKGQACIQGRVEACGKAKSGIQEEGSYRLRREWRREYDGRRPFRRRASLCCSEC